ncbi:unnamed protein product [Cyprideis torosa]|uniref:XK-related protein n=1 Tax=Cyprideis torosa TaxID=163714 RepID=A0A7R8WD83_9CRUS|nr:unnamed protein product [Cyprideis torosa]CAG0892887.1 unnamed protein product [Cyprideis torosa]
MPLRGNSSTDTSDDELDREPERIEKTKSWPPPVPEDSTWPIPLYVFVYYVLPILLDLLIYTADIISDFWVGVSHMTHAHWLYGILTIFFMYLPSILLLSYKIGELWNATDRSLFAKVFFSLRLLTYLAFFPFWPIFRYSKLLPFAWHAMKYEENREDNLAIVAERSNAKFFRFLEVWFESVPQFLLQMHIVFQNKPEDQNYYMVPPTPSIRFPLAVVPQVFCVCASVASISMSVTTYDEHVLPRQRLLPFVHTPLTMKTVDMADHGANDEEEEAYDVEAHDDDFIANIFRFLGWFFHVAGRGIAISLFASAFGAWFWLVFLSHIAIGTILLFTKNRDPPNPCVLGRLVLTSYIFYFVIIQFKLKFKNLYSNVRLLHVAYFAISLIENFIILMLWFTAVHSDVWYHTFGLAGTLGCSLAGIFFLLFACYIVQSQQTSRRKIVELQTVVDP